MAALYARTYDEANLYMDVRPCETCGEVDFDRQSTLGSERGIRLLRCEGRCAGCGEHREFEFRLPDRREAVGSEVRYGPDGEPSRLLDAGEWLAVSDMFAELAANLRGDASRPDELADDQIAAVYDLLATAAAAADEATKFLPPDGERVPPASVWSPTGRMLRELAPERFERDALAGAAAERRRAVDSFEALVAGR